MIHKVVAVLFIVFAVVQYNDPDFFIWVPLYLIVAVVAILIDRGWRDKKVVFGLCLMYFLAMLTYIPEVISYFQNGTPSIAAAMQAESPYIEFMREFLGLGICLGTLTLYLRWMIKNRKSSKLNIQNNS